MIAEAVRRSPLADYRERFVAFSTASRGNILVREVPYLAQINFRADPDDAVIMRRLASTLGFALPVVPNTTTSQRDRRALWLGPDEWLVVGPDGQQQALQHELRNGLDGAYGSIVDVSANRTVLEIGGSTARERLARAVPIDLDARSFGPDRCAQTLFAKAQVVIEGRAEQAVHVYVRTSFASYLADWLLDAAAE
ncbi:MAG TPA: sarcosine oxidase subunit gamma family protein [Candidatus Dormibacteraeota bacterium]